MYNKVIQSPIHAVSFLSSNENSDTFHTFIYFFNPSIPTKVYLVKAMVFPVVMCGCESWAVKKAEL